MKSIKIIDLFGFFFLKSYFVLFLLSLIFSLFFLYFCFLDNQFFFCLFFFLITTLCPICLEVTISMFTCPLANSEVNQDLYPLTKQNLEMLRTLT